MIKAWRGRARLATARVARRRRRLVDAGMATAEYAVVTVAACAFAGLLLAVVRSPEVRSLLLGIIRRALSV
jgi:hypothetical protein